MSLACFLLGSLALAQTLQQPGSGAPDWRILKPSNTGIPGDYVQTLYIDEDDLPWIAAYIPIWEEGGMAHWDDGERWFAVSNVDHPEIASPRFNDIERDADGVLWIASDHGLLKYDPSVGPESLVRFDKSNSPLPANQMHAMAFSPDGALWIAIADVTTAAGGLARYVPATGTWTTWTTQNGLPWGAAWPGWNQVHFVDVVNNAQGYTVWFGNGNQGMATLRNGVFRWLQANPMPGPLPVAFRSEDPVDAQGNAWMETNAGLARRDPAGNFVVTGYPAGLSTEVAIVSAISGGRALLGTFYADVFLWDGGWSYLGNWGSGNHTYALAEDSQGRFWAGGIGGAARLEPGGWQRYRLTNTGMVGYWVQTIDFDSAGNVYLDGNAGPGVGGFSIYDGVHWTNANSATYGLGLPWPFPSDSVTALVVRANGKLAFSPYANGVHEWDGTSYSTILAPGWVLRDMVEDGLGRLWGCDTDRLILMRGTQATHFTSANAPIAGDVYALVADEEQPGFVWAVLPFWVLHTNGETWTVHPREVLGLTQNTTSQILYAGTPAPDGTFWAGSGQGLYHVDWSTGEFTRFTTANSALPSDEIKKVHIAPDGSVWVASFDSTWPYPGGLTHFRGNSSTTYTTSNSSLPHNQIWELGSRRVPGGYELWVGTASEGIAVVTERSTPQSISPVRYP